MTGSEAEIKSAAGILAQAAPILLKINAEMQQAWDSCPAKSQAVHVALETDWPTLFTRALAHFHDAKWWLFLQPKLSWQSHFGYKDRVQKFIIKPACPKLIGYPDYKRDMAIIASQLENTMGADTSTWPLKLYKQPEPAGPTLDELIKALQFECWGDAEETYETETQIIE